MLLLVDVAGDTEQAVTEAADKVVEMATVREAEALLLLAPRHVNVSGRIGPAPPRLLPIPMPLRSMKMW